MRVVAIVGHKGSGKTTLIERLIGSALERGLSVSTVKHAHHHDVELDTPGKDSYRHRKAGASEVIVASDQGWARIAAYHLHATRDSCEITRPARRAFLARFEAQADPDHVLAPDERERGARLLRRAHFSALAVKSADARRRRSVRHKTPQGAPGPTDPELQELS